MRGEISGCGRGFSAELQLRVGAAVYLRQIGSGSGWLPTVWGPMTLATVLLYPAGQVGSEEHRKKGLAKSDILVYLLLAVAGVFLDKFSSLGARPFRWLNAAQYLRGRRSGS